MLSFLSYEVCYMKKQLILPVALLFGLVSCTGTDGSSSGTSTTDKDSQTSDVTSSTSESSSSSSSSSKEDSSSSTSSSSSSSSSISSTSSSIPDEVDPLLEEAIAKMGVNYTANVYYGGEITYRHICTDDGIYKDYFDEYKSSGFVFKDDLAYFFELKNGVQIIDDHPYEDFYGNPYTKEQVIETDYQVSSIKAEYFVKTAANTYEAKTEYLDSLCHDILYEDTPTSIILTTENGLLKSIAFNDFYDDYYGELDSAEVVFTDIGTTVLDFSKPDTNPFLDQLPPENDPSKPVSTEKSTYGVKKAIDNYVLPEDTSGGVNTELQTALKATKQKVSFTLSDYFDDTVNKDKGGSSWQPSTRERNYVIDGYEIYIEEPARGTHSYFAQAEGKAYSINDSGFYFNFVEKAGDIATVALGGNPFWALSSEMFEVGSAAGTYALKKDYYPVVATIFDNMGRDKDYFYSGSPSTYISAASVTLVNGAITTLTIDRYFTFNDGYDDLQTLTFTITDQTKAMPYDDDYLSADQKVLRDAILKTGNNYTLDIDYYDDYDRVEFYGDRVIYKQYQNAWGSSGFVYVNDYAYYFDMDEEGLVSVGEEPYTDFYGNPYYRDWMNKTYLPLVTINPLHWTLNADGSYEADAIGLDVINDIFYEDSPLSCNITLTEDGYVDAINFDCAAAGYSDGTCTAKVIDIGTTNYTGPQA